MLHTIFINYILLKIVYWFIFVYMCTYIRTLLHLYLFPMLKFEKIAVQNLCV